MCCVFYHVGFIKVHLTSLMASFQSLSSSCSCCSSSRPAETSCFFCLNTSCPLPPAQLLSTSVTNKDFAARLSGHLGSILRDQSRKRNREGKKGKDIKDQEEEEERRLEEKIFESQEVQSNVEGTHVRSHR